MKLTRYQDSQGQIHYAGNGCRIDGDIFGPHRLTTEPADVKKLLAPIVPAAILCIGLNYRRHAQETNAPIPQFPVLFMKNPGALQNPGDPILLPTHLRSDEVDYEAELAIVIGQRCQNVSRQDAFKYVLGYTCANDVSARDWQKKWSGGQWCRGKSFDTFCPLGPCLVTPAELPNPNALQIRTIVSGEVLQN